MANKKKKAVTKKSSRPKKTIPLPKKKAVKKTVKKRAAVKASKPALKKKPVKKAAGKPVKKAAPKVSPPSASAKKIVAEQLGVKEGEVTNDASFVDDLGADSLDTVVLVMALEE